MRPRSDSIPFSYYRDRQWSNHVDGFTEDQSFSGTTLASKMDYKSSRSGESNPRYKQVIADGGDATNSYDASCTWAETTGANVFIKVKNKSNQWAIGNGGVWQYCPTQPWYRSGGNYYWPPTNAYAALAAQVTLSGQTAESKALDSIWSAISESTAAFKGATFAGTIFETLDGIKHPARELTRLHNEFGMLAQTILRNGMRKGTKLALAEAHKVIGGTWLEWNFGIAPLLSDIDAGAQALADLVTDTGGTRRVRGFGTESKSTQTSELWGPTFTVGGAGIGESRMSVYYTKTEEVNVNYTVGLRHPSGLTDRLIGRQRLGLTFDQFVPTLYELTPFSFILDYFSNMGSVLEQLFQSEDNICWISKTTTIKNSYSISGDIFVTGPSYTGGGKTDRKSVV